MSLNSRPLVAQGIASVPVAPEKGSVTLMLSVSVQTGCCATCRPTKSALVSSGMSVESSTEVGFPMPSTSSGTRSPGFAGSSWP